MEKVANGRGILLFGRELEMNELFYSIYVNKSIEQFNISICDTYERGCFERFDILEPSVAVFKDKLVISFDDYQLSSLDPEIISSAYKIINYKDIRDSDEGC